MAKRKKYKNVRRMYKDDGDHITFTYYNCTYSCQTVSLVKMLFEEILKDIPTEKSDSVYIRMLPTFPFEIVLEFSFPKYELEHFDLSQFEKMPDDFRKL